MNKKIYRIGSFWACFTFLLFLLLTVFSTTANQNQASAASGDELCLNESSSFTYEVGPISEAFKSFINNGSLHGLNIAYDQSNETIILPKSFSLSSAVKAKVLDNKSSWETLSSYYKSIEGSLNSYCPDLVTQAGSPASTNWQKAREAQTIINNAITDATASGSSTSGRRITINVDQAILLGSKKNITIGFIGYKDLVFQLWIQDKTGTWQPKLSTQDPNHPDRQIDSDPDSFTYSWNTSWDEGGAQTTAGDRNIQVKVFTKSGTYIEGSLTTACSRVYESTDKDTTSGCNGSSTSSDNPVNTGTKFDGNIDANKFNFFGIKTETDLKTYLQERLIDYIFPILLGFLALVGIIMGGVQLLMAQGDDSKIAKGKKTILLTVAGIIVATTAIAIYAGVLSVLRALGYVK